MRFLESYFLKDNNPLLKKDLNIVFELEIYSCKFEEHIF